MDAQGFLPISLIASFHRVQALTTDVNLIIEVTAHHQSVQLHKLWHTNISGRYLFWTLCPLMRWVYKNVCGDANYQKFRIFWIMKINVAFEDTSLPNILLLTITWNLEMGTCICLRFNESCHSRLWRAARRWSWWTTRFAAKLTQNAGPSPPLPLWVLLGLTSPSSSTVPSLFPDRLSAPQTLVSIQFLLWLFM